MLTIKHQGDSARLPFRQWVIGYDFKKYPFHLITIGMHNAGQFHSGSLGRWMCVRAAIMPLEPRPLYIRRPRAIIAAMLQKTAGGILSPVAWRTTAAHAVFLRPSHGVHLYGAGRVGGRKPCRSMLGTENPHGPAHPDLSRGERESQPLAWSTIITTLTLGTSAIRQLDGLYSLNDLHQAAGGDKQHQPANFLRLEQTQALIAEISNSSDLRNYIPMKTSAGRHGGTYVCRELVYAYANWISPAFYLKMIRAFDALQSAAVPPAPTLAPPAEPGLSSAVKARIQRRAHELTLACYDTIHDLLTEMAESNRACGADDEKLLGYIDHYGGVAGEVVMLNKSEVMMLARKTATSINILGETLATIHSLESHLGMPLYPREYDPSIKGLPPTLLMRLARAEGGERSV